MIRLGALGKTDSGNSTTTSLAAPPMPVTTIDGTTPQQGSREAVELLAEQETHKQESASLNGRFHALTSGHSQSHRV